MKYIVSKVLYTAVKFILSTYLSTSYLKYVSANIAQWLDSEYHTYQYFLSTQSSNLVQHRVNYQYTVERVKKYLDITIIFIDGVVIFLYLDQVLTTFQIIKEFGEFVLKRLQVNYKDAGTKEVKGGQKCNKHIC